MNRLALALLLAAPAHEPPGAQGVAVGVALLDLREPGDRHDLVGDALAGAEARLLRRARRTGAGGGGFLMLFCAPAHQADVTRALENAGLKRMAFHFENGGAKVLVNAGLRLNGTTSHVQVQV